MAIKDWSTTPASNASAGSINFAEGQPPSTVNDSARQMMADLKEGLFNVATDVASAGTTDLGAVGSNYVNVTGTTTITSFGTVSSGIWKFVKFAGALTLTHNATSLILPGGANITTAAGDTLKAVSEGSGNWRVLSYTKASGGPIAGGTAASTSYDNGDSGLTATDVQEAIDELASTKPILYAAQATTSGTAFDFTNIPSWVNRIAVYFGLVSLSGGEDILVQLGTSGGIVTTGYTSGSGEASTSSAGMVVRLANAARAASGILTLERMSGNTWVSAHSIHFDNPGDVAGGGIVTLAGALTQLRITRTGSNTFDNGSVAIRAFP